jgi:dihydrofolate reductase
MKAYVVSTTLNPQQHPDVTVISADVADMVKLLKAGSGKDIWLFGGGVLFRYLLDEGLVDAVDIAVEPVLLGSGVPVVPEGRRSKLKLAECKARPSGVVMLKYEVR